MQGPDPRRCRLPSSDPRVGIRSDRVCAPGAEAPATWAPLRPYGHRGCGVRRTLPLEPEADLQPKPGVRGDRAADRRSLPTMSGVSDSSERYGIESGKSGFKALLPSRDRACGPLVGRPAGRGSRGLPSLQGFPSRDRGDVFTTHPLTSFPAIRPEGRMADAPQGIAGSGIG